MYSINNIENIEEEEIVKIIKTGKILIYPTDTIYGIGCDATNKTSVNKIKKIKCRERNKPLSIIVPSIMWIKKNCIVPKNLILKKYLPGPYTLILKKRNPKFLNHVSETDSIGIRIPKNKFTKIIQKTNRPFISTSVNLSGEKPITKISEIINQIKNKVDCIIDAGQLSGKPSTIIINEMEIRRD